MEKYRWIIRSFIDSDFEKVSQLRERFSEGGAASERRSIAPEYYRWKILENPFQEGLLHVAEDGGRVVSMTSITPKRLLICGKLEDGAEIGDTFTHREYVRQGIFTKLVNLSREKALQRNANFIYGTPNDNSMPGYERKCNFAQIPSAKVYGLVRPLNVISVLKAKYDLPALCQILAPVIDTAYNVFYRVSSPRLEKHGMQFSLDSNFPEDTYDLWLKTSGNYEWILERSLEYMKWRYIRNPDTYSIWLAKKNHRLMGFLVTKSGSWRNLKVGYLADFLIDEEYPGIFVELISRALSSFKEKSLDMAAVWTVKESLYCRILEDFGFRTYGRIPVICYKNDLGSRMIDQQRKWHFTMADSDNI